VNPPAPRAPKAAGAVGEPVGGFREPAAPGGALDAAPEPDAHAIARAVLAVPAVADLHTGLAGEVATYLPGERVGGVVVREETVTVHVVVRWPTPVAEAARQVRAAVAPLAAGRRVDTVAADIVLP